MEELPANNLDKQIDREQDMSKLINDPFREVIKRHLKEKDQSHDQSYGYNQTQFLNNDTYNSYKNSHVLPTTDRESLTSQLTQNLGKNIKENSIKVSSGRTCNTNNHPPKQPVVRQQEKNLSKNLKLLDQFENIQYQESGDSDQEEQTYNLKNQPFDQAQTQLVLEDYKMPELVEEDMSKFKKNLPLGVSNLSKEQFLRMMMLDSYNSDTSNKIEEVKTRATNQTSNQQANFTSGRIRTASRNHEESDQSHIKIDSNFSSNMNKVSENEEYRQAKILENLKKKYDLDQEEFESNNSSQSNHFSALEKSFRDEMMPLAEQAKKGVFDKLHESGDDIDLMINDYKKQLGLAMKMSKSSFDYRQGLKEPRLNSQKDGVIQADKDVVQQKEKIKMLNKIENIKHQAQELILSAPQQDDTDDFIWYELRQEKQKLLRLVDDVLNSSERGKIDGESANRIFKKFESIKGKEKILSDCGIKKSDSNGNVKYEYAKPAVQKGQKYEKEGKQHDKQDNSNSLEDESLMESKLEKNISQIQSMLMQSQDVITKDGSFGIDISSLQNGHFKKANLNNFISFNNGDTMMLGSLDESRKASLAYQMLPSVNNNVTFNGSSYFSNNSKQNTKGTFFLKKFNFLY